jgi:hypothetical protein
MAGRTRAATPPIGMNGTDKNHASAFLPIAILRRGRALLNQQCWLWGQDVKREEGNLLLAYGFDRLRPPADESGSSQYTFCPSAGLHIRLWGFGFYFGGSHGVYLNRYDFTPRLALFEDCWQSQSMTGLPRTQDLALLPMALHWIEGYERWIAETVGLSYREACLCGWKRRATPPAFIADAWCELAREVEACHTGAEVISARQDEAALPQMLAG